MSMPRSARVSLWLSGGGCWHWWSNVKHETDGQSIVQGSRGIGRGRDGGEKEDSENSEKETRVDLLDS